MALSKSVNFFHDNYDNDEGGDNDFKNLSQLLVICAKPRSPYPQLLAMQPNISQLCFLTVRTSAQVSIPHRCSPGMDQVCVTVIQPHLTLILSFLTQNKSVISSFSNVVFSRISVFSCLPLSNILTITFKLRTKLKSSVSLLVIVYFSMYDSIMIYLSYFRSYLEVICIFCSYYQYLTIVATGLST